MEMTYAALAKSLGINLKPVSSSSSTSYYNSTTPAASASEPIPAAISTQEEDVPTPVKESPPSSESEKGGSSQEKHQSPSESLPLAPVDTKKTETEENFNGSAGTNPGPGVTEDVDSDADAEGILDSDIASTRPPSPTTEPSRETVESRSAESTGVSQCTDRHSDKDPDYLETPSNSKTTRRESMTDEELHHAKVLVLDLLGWGVPPEYLLQRGISHALLYTVFTDLRLRLPDAILADCVKLVSV